MKSVLDWILKFACWLYNRLFLYPVKVTYANQVESRKGYILEIDICSKGKKLVSIPKDKFGINLILDADLLKTADTSKKLYGERAQVFDSLPALEAFLAGRSYGNVTRSVQCNTSATRIYLLITVKGPGSTNPSSRLQLAKLYTRIRITIRKRILRLTYLEVRLRQIAIVAGNDITRIVDTD